MLIYIINNVKDIDSKYIQIMINEYVNPLIALSNNKLEKYESILSKKKLNLNVYDVFNKNPMDYCEDKKLLESLGTYEKIAQYEIPMQQLQPYNIFTGNHYDAMIYYTHFLNQYKHDHAWLWQDQQVFQNDLLKPVA